MPLQLLSFPEEILAVLLDFDDILHKSIDLWLCGSKALQSRMSRVVTRVSLHCSDTIIYHGLPQFLIQLSHLRSLDVSRSGKPFYRPHHIIHTLRQLNPGLAELKFVVQHSSMYFFPQTAQDNSVSDSLQKLFRELDFNLSATFPALKSLVLDEKAVLHAETIKALPEDLEVLQCDAIDPSRWIECACALPRSLKRLKMDRLYSTGIFDATFWNSLPPSLTSVSIKYHDLPGNPSPDMLSVFPRQLLVLDLPAMWLGIKWNMDFLQALPPKLQVFNICKYEESETEAIAAFLQQSSARILGTDYVPSTSLPPIILGSLPPTLTSLEGRFTLGLASPRQRKGPITLPDHLLHLIIRPTKNEFGAIPFPPRLSILDIRNACFDITQDIVNTLPKTLVSVHIACDKQEDNLIFDLPHLATLHLSSLSSFTSQSQVDTSPVRNLPPSLTNLTINSPYLSWKIIFELPPTLSTLHLQIVDNRDFVSNHAQVLARAQEMYGETSPQKQITWLELLPRSLDFFHVLFTHPVNWEGLPPKLRSLVAPRSNHLMPPDANTAKLFPRSLTRLDFPLEKPSKEFLVNLPKGLRTAFFGYSAQSDPDHVYSIPLQIYGSFSYLTQGLEELRKKQIASLSSDDPSEYIRLCVEPYADRT